MHCSMPTSLPNNLDSDGKHDDDDDQDGSDEDDDDGRDESLLGACYTEGTVSHN